MGTLRKCRDCGEPTLNPERCRDCGIEHQFASMTCSVCKKMHTARDGRLGEIATALWGSDHRCECPEPKPPMMVFP